MVNRDKVKDKFKIVKGIYLFIPFVLFVALIITYILVFNYYFADKIYPGVQISGIKVGGLTYHEAEKLISSSFDHPDEIELVAKNKNYKLSLNDIDFKYTVTESVNQAYKVHRDNVYWRNYYLSLISPLIKRNVPIDISLNENRLNEFVQVVADEVASEPVYPNAELDGKEVVIEKGKIGETLAVESFINLLKKRLKQNNFSAINIPFTSIDPTLNDLEAEKFKEKAEKYVNKSLQLNYEYETITLKDDKLLSLIDPNDALNQRTFDDSLVSEVESKFNREPENAVFKYENGRVMEFIPAKNGVVVDTLKLKNDIVEGLSNLAQSDDELYTINVPVKTEAPSITTKQVNDLGINELIGRGTSTFRGSITSRMHNIAHAAAKFNGVLVPPGEIFSFNNTLGDVSALTGYKQAYVIKDGRTVLGDGGGVCQVSTTFFRAILDAGLPVVERRSHSYRVSYYEQDAGPGLDATVYAPTTDLKFKNDTPGHLLIQTQYDGVNASLVFEIYGTSDGRESEITEPVIVSSTPPPEDLYIDDPELPVGQVKQVEHKVWGAKTVFNYKVVRNGEILIDRDFISNFRPWQAVFLRGTGPAI